MGACKYRLIDLFAGAGGMTLGFTQAGFAPVWANDFNRDAVRTYNANFADFGEHCIEGDISALLADNTTSIPAADVVIGGPPCQGFSLLNKNRASDPRKQMWRPFLEVVRRSEADLFVIENVAQLLNSPECGELALAARALGFQVTSAKLLAADYGVPQQRWRAFIVGCRFADPSLLFPPPKTHCNPALDTALCAWRTVRDCIADLPEPQGTRIGPAPPLDLHFGRTPTPLSLQRYRAIPEEGMNRFDLQRRALELTPPCWIRKTSGGTDLFGRLWWDRPAFTIRTEFFKPEKGRYLHPSQHRPITHREAARLQSFPDWFRFHGSKGEIARQIGNAVPPLLARRVAESVVAMLDMRERERVA